ncbi:DEAD/DEAH box helicase [Aliamphritea hakodatensis]|uniref:DEAD/DEAH box helicase n=1 Tax=Aliamphritea hakodatensis TaxID=2895352 RepID=UPI0022FD4239|nr:DEAD/DEAH box helicase [Aliamphritea hakodatensis]
MKASYEQLDVSVQKWLFKQGWSDLREIQKLAIEPILSGCQDVLISASTAAGKTEAFFLPASSAVANVKDGFSILYISPLKALINDQYRRLDSLAEMLEMDVTPWHGDSSQAKKKKARSTPSGILLITPESLESLLVRESGWVNSAFNSLSYVVIDEFHAFIGTERGMQLLSLLNRLEHLLDRYDKPIPRVALSATLGDLEQVPKSLRPDQSLPCEIITNSKSTATIKCQVRGFVEPASQEGNAESADTLVCSELYQLCRGDSHLVFANSRNNTENLAARLVEMCEENIVPNEFFPHHGSLSKELREDLEQRLQKGNLPTTALCTMTLELGIDIGKVKSVIQVNAPHSVSSLRQRLGRSGRRGNPSILRMFITEDDVTIRSGIVDKLRLELVQSLAMIRLLLDSKWFEPADTSQYHFSTLLHQVLAVTAQWGGVRADQLFTLLCKKGPFQNVTTEHFVSLLKHMGNTRLLTQLGSGELVLGIEGEKIVNHYTFYAVFQTPEEYRVVVGAKTLGTLPVDSLVLPSQHIVFAGRRWKVLDVDSDKKVINVEATKGGKPPKFGGSGMFTHGKIRQEMYKIYSQGDYRIDLGSQKVDFADAVARELFNEGAKYFKEANLTEESVIQSGKSVCILTWSGDRVANTLVAILLSKGVQAGSYAGVVEVENSTVTNVKRMLKDIVVTGLPTETELAEMASDKIIDKFDELVSPEILSIGFGHRVFDVKKLHSYLVSMF